MGNQSDGSEDAWTLKTLRDGAPWNRMAAGALALIERLQAELADEKKLAGAISRDCNDTALERNALRDELHREKRHHVEWLEAHGKEIEVAYRRAAEAEKDAIERAAKVCEDRARALRAGRVPSWAEVLDCAAAIRDLKGQRDGS